MVEMTHFPAFILAALEEFVLRVLERSFVKQFLTLIRSFLFIFTFVLDQEKRISLMFRQLLQLNIRYLFII